MNIFRPGGLTTGQAAELNKLAAEVRRLGNFRVSGNASLIRGPGGIVVDVPTSDGLGLYSADRNQGVAPPAEFHIRDILQTTTRDKTYFFNINLTTAADTSYDPALDANYLLNDYTYQVIYYLAVRSRNSASAFNLGTDPIVVGAKVWGGFTKQWILINGSGGDYYATVGGGYPSSLEYERGSLCGVFNNGSTDTTLYLTGGYTAFLYGAATPPSPLPFACSAVSADDLLAFETSGYQYTDVPFTPNITTGFVAI